MVQQVTLRKAQPEDADAIAGWFCDKEIVNYVLSTPLRCETYTRGNIEEDIRNSNPDTERLFMVCAEGEEKPVGHAGIDDISLQDKTAQIWFLVDQSKRRRGYGEKIVRLLLDYAFNEMGLNSIFADACIDNKASSTLLEKVGFKRIGIRRAYQFIDGKYVNQIFFDILRDEYVSQAKPAEADATKKDDAPAAQPPQPA